MIARFIIQLSAQACAGAALLLALLASAAPTASADPQQLAWSQAQKYGMPFVENRGQIADPDVRFYARTFGGTVYVLRSGTVVYALPKRAPEANPSSQLPDLRTVGLAVLKESFAGALNPQPVGGQPAGATVNCFLGQSPQNWQTGLAAYEIISLGEIYAGISLELRAYGNNVEKIFTVAPGADPKQIKVLLEGAQALTLNARQELEATTDLGNVSFSAPLAWQVDDAGCDIPVSIAYVLADNSFGFNIGAYDPTRPLMIDPLLASTFVGGGGADQINAVTVIQGSGEILVAGASDSLNCPINAASQSSLHGGQDVFIAKFDSHMTNLIVSTYFGGGADDVAKAIALDVWGNIFVAGYTESTDLPAAFNSASGARDAFIARFNSNLANPSARYLGGSGNDSAHTLALHPNNSVYLAGYTESADFPMTPNSGAYQTYSGAGDGFIVYFNNQLSQALGASFLGGAHQDSIQALTINPTADVYVAGYTYSSNFPTTNACVSTFLGSCDAFVSRFSVSLTNLNRSTFIGGTNEDRIYAIALDASDNVVVAGYTYSPSNDFRPFISTNAAQKNLAGGCDAFIMALWPPLTNRVSATYLGGTGDDKAWGLAVGTNIYSSDAKITNVIVVGHTASSNFPSTPNAYNSSPNGGLDAFVAVLKMPLTNWSNLSAVSYLGGTADDYATAVAIAADNSVIAAGYTASKDFPVYDANFSTRYNGGAQDGFLSRLAGTLTYGTKKWEIGEPGAMYSAPCMGPDGTIYATTANRLYAINPDGTIKWSYPLGLMSSSPMASPAISTNGLIYVGDDEGYMWAIDASSGEYIYSSDIGKFCNCPAIDKNGNLYIGVWDAVGFSNPLGLYRLSADTSIAQILCEGNQFLGSSAALGTNADLYVGAAGGAFNFYCLNSLTGATNGMLHETNANFHSSPAISASGVVFVGAENKKLYSINPDGTAAQTWILDSEVASPVIDTNDLVYVGTINGTLYMINPHVAPEHSILRTWSMGSILSTPALGADGSLYVAAGSSLHSLNPQSGATNWSCGLQEDAKARSPLIGMDGTIYIGSGDQATLYAIHGSTPPDLEAPWPRFHHDMMNSGWLGLDPRPTPPDFVAASRATGDYTNSVLVHWSAVPYAKVYEIYRSLSDDVGTAAKIASTWQTNYLDNIDVELGEIYHYWIRAKAPLGNSVLSESAYGGTIPLAPLNVAASKGGAHTNAILITWEPSIGAIEYQLWRGANDDTNAAELIFCTASTNYMDANITQGLKYYYWLKASNVIGTSDFSSNDYGGTPPAPPAPQAEKGGAFEYLPVNWDAAAGAETYLIYYSPTNQLSSASLITNITDAPFNHYGLIPCRHYYYWIQATNEFGLGDFSAADWGWRALAPPAAVSASDNLYASKIQVEWVVGDTEYTTAHQVYRSQTNDTQTAELRLETFYSDPTMTNYTDLEILRGPLYYYWVRAKNSYGTSDFSQVDSGGTLPRQPTGLAVSEGTYSDKILITWHTAEVANAYLIYRSMDSDTNHAIMIQSVDADSTSLEDFDTQPGQIYYYWARTLTEAGISLFSGADFGWRGLTAPTGLTASDGNSTEHVLLSWDQAAGIASYEVWRSRSADPLTATKLASGITTNSYADISAIAGQIYYYWVKARANIFISEFSNGDSGYQALGLVDIGVSDLVLLPAAMAAGSHPSAVSYRLANYGMSDMEAPHNLIQADFYLSTNATLDANAVCFGSYVKGVPLRVDSSVNIALNQATRQLLTIPDLPAGRYYAFVRVDHCLPSALSDPRPNNNSARRVGQIIEISTNQAAPTVINDYDGDSRSDMAVYHESDGRWYIRSLEGARLLYGASWGGYGFQPVVGNYGANNAASLAMYHAETGLWFIRNLSNQRIAWQHWWGAPGYLPVPGDYDGDGTYDLAVYGVADGYWYIESLAGRRIAWAESWGAPDYLPVPGDYDGDGKADFAVYGIKDGYWYIRNLAGQRIAWAESWGAPDYLPVPGDYDGDGVYDLAVYHQPTGYWFIRSVAGQQIAWGEWWGAPGYLPVPGDYNGDGVYDLAVYNEALGLWYIRTLTGQSLAVAEWWGAPGYKAVSGLPLVP